MTVLALPAEQTQIRTKCAPAVRVRVCSRVGPGLLLADRKIHYFIRGRLMVGPWGGANASGSREAADIAEWVETHFAPMTVDRAIIYDLTEPPKNT